MHPAADPLAPYARLAVAGLIRRSSGREHTEEARWLLLHRVTPFEAWDPPGGRMEAGEDLAQAVTREVREETGLAVDIGGPCYAFLTFYEGERLLVVSMACRPLGDPDDVCLEAGGATGWRWVDTDEWERLATAGASSWRPEAVKRAARMATALWEVEEE